MWSIKILLFVVVVVSGNDGTYEEACDSIIAHAQKASKYFNAGHVEMANREKELAKRGFRRATRIDDTHPQAYLNMANFLLNTQELEESVRYWDIVASMIGDEQELRDYVKSRRTKARFGLYSKSRDRAYNEDKNLTEALFWSKKQLEVIENHPEVHFDRGTIQIMLNMSSDKIISSLRTSQNVSFAGWISDRRARGYACTDLDSRIVYDWTSYDGRYLRILKLSLSLSLSLSLHPQTHTPHRWK